MIVQESKEDRIMRERKEVIERKQFLDDKQRERDAQIKIAEINANAEIESAKISQTPAKIDSQSSIWSTVFNAPARFVAVIFAYRLERRGISTPEWLQKFIGG